MVKRLTFLCCVILSSFGWGQENLTIMYYNILNYPDSSPDRCDTLRKIVQYVKPDLLVVNELHTEAGADLILTKSLNQFGITSYQRAAFIDGNDTDNMLFYNSDKVGLQSQTQIETTLRDISEYIVYYKSPGLGPLSDTIYLNVYSAHLKAGAGDFAQRAEECQVLKYHLNTRTNIENAIVGGDFNFYSGHESGCLILRETGAVKLYDPLDEIGDWSGNFSYADLHTQSTRTSSFGSGSGGGMDDRFDLIFVSDDLFDFSNGARYVEDSYWALGQDGNRFNQSVISPANFSVPDSVSESLYYMSDHLPVLMEIEMDYTTGLKEKETPTFDFTYDAYQQLFRVSEPLNYKLSVFSLDGKEVFYKESDEQEFTLQLEKGVYIIHLRSGERNCSKKISLL